MSRLWPQQGSYWKNRRFVLIIFKSNDYSGIKSVIGPTEGIGRFPVQLCEKIWTSLKTVFIWFGQFEHDLKVIMFGCNTSEKCL